MKKTKFDEYDEYREELTNCISELEAIIKSDETAKTELLKRNTVDYFANHRVEPLHLPINELIDLAHAIIDASKDLKK